MIVVFQFTFLAASASWGRNGNEIVDWNTKDDRTEGRYSRGDCERSCFVKWIVEDAAVKKTPLIIDESDL